MFLRHVIGGKHLSKGPRFARMVRMATPDAVLTGVSLLADTVTGGDLLVVDVGGATTDVYSALVPDGGAAGVAGTLWRARTVEGDLGVRWNVDGVHTAAGREHVTVGDGPLGVAAAATVIAVRRHARTGRDLRDVVSVIASGGVFRHAERAAALAALDPALHDHAGGWALPRAPRSPSTTGMSSPRGAPRRRPSRRRGRAAPGATLHVGDEGASGGGRRLVTRRG